MSSPQPSCDQLPYGLASPTDTYTRGLQKMLTPPPLTSEFMGMAGYAPAYFTTSWMMRLKAMAPALEMSWHPATLCPRSAL